MTSCTDAESPGLGIRHGGDKTLQDERGAGAAIVKGYLLRPQRLGAPGLPAHIEQVSRANPFEDRKAGGRLQEKRSHAEHRGGADQGHTGELAGHHPQCASHADADAQRHRQGHTQARG